MRKKLHKKNSQRGSVIFESVLAICVLMLIFFGMFQVYRWAITELFCHYSSYYGSKGAALGYRPNISLRAARVAAIAVSGGAISHENEEHHAKSYMQYGDASGYSRPYWHPQTIREPAAGDDLRQPDPYLRVMSTRLAGEKIECIVKMENMPLLNEAISKVFGITKNPEPQSHITVYNHSHHFLNEGL